MYIYIELYMDMELHIWLVCNHAYERTTCDWHFTFHGPAQSFASVGCLRSGEKLQVASCNPMKIT